MAKFDHRKAGEEADEMIRKLNQVVDVPTEDQSGAPEAIVQDHTNADDQGGSDPGASDAGAVGTQSTPPVTEQQDADITALNARVAKAEARWNVLQGILQKKEDENADLRKLLAGLAERPAQPDPVHDQGVVATSTGPAYTAEDVREFGQPLIDFVERVATAAARSVRAELSDSFSKQVGTLQQSVNHVAEESNAERGARFTRRLGHLVPTWEQINVDPLFVNDWLQQTERLSGRSRLQLLRDAYQALDADRAAQFFLDYQEEMNPAPAEAPPSHVPKPTSLVTPGRSRATAAPKQSGSGKVWTRADIAKLYDDKMKRKITAEEFAKQERDLFKAQSEGRVEAAA